MTDKVRSIDIQCPVNLARKSFRQDPYPTLDAIRKESPAIVVEANGFRMWLLTRYKDALRVLSDPTFNKDLIEHRREVVAQSAINASRRARVPAASRRSMLDRDGEDHKRLRKLFRGVFSRGMADSHAESFKSLANRILDVLPVDSPIDLIAEFARPLAMTFISEFYGVPAELGIKFSNWENSMLTGASIEEVEAGGKSCYEFALHMIDVKRQTPSEDIFTELLRMHEERPEIINESELASTYIVLMIGGSEVANAIGNGLQLLLANPKFISELRKNPDLISRYVEEILRYESPFRLLPPRFSSKPLTLDDDITIPPGELVAVAVASANRDPDIFSNPQNFDPLQERQHILSFGHGAHTCLGMHLARMEIGEALLVFVKRFSNCKCVDESSTAHWRSGDFMRRLDKLIVTLGPDGI